jgi:hypothetical protein
MSTIVKTSDIRVGDKVGRQVAKDGPVMWLTVTHVEEDVIRCNLWTFDRATGAEIDHELQWGPEYGRTGSYITQIQLTGRGALEQDDEAVS